MSISINTNTHMKKETYNAIRTLLIALTIGVGVSFVSAEVWTEPGCTLPDCNVAAPINTGTSMQIKKGSANFISNDGNGEIRTDILSVFGTSYFADDVKVGDPNSPYFKPDTNLYVTGKLGINLDATAIVTPLPTAEVDINGTVRFSQLAEINNEDAPYPAPVCVSNAGDLELCAYPAPLFGVIFSPSITNQLLYLDGIENNADDYNCSADVSVSGNVTGGVAPIIYSWSVRYNGGAPLALINGANAADNNYHSIGTGTTATFEVDVKNPNVANRDSWTVKFAAVDDDGSDITLEKDFEVWTLSGCAD